MNWISDKLHHPDGAASMLHESIPSRHVRFLHGTCPFAVFKQPHIWHVATCRQGGIVARRVGFSFIPPIHMEMKKSQQEVVSTPMESSETPDTSKSPLKVLRVDDISASVFERIRDVSGKPIAFHNVSFSRSYRDDQGKRQYTKSFSTDDLGKLASLAVQAHEFIQSLNPEAPKA